MDKELRLPFWALLCGLVLFIVLSAPMLAMIPLVTGIVFLINKQLLNNEWWRNELHGVTILKIVNRWLDLEIDQIVVGTFVLTAAQFVLAILAVTPGLRLDQQLAYAWVYCALLVVELAVIFLMPFGHVQLRWSRMSQSGRVAVFAIVSLIASVLCLFHWSTPLLFSGPALVFGASILLLGFNTEGPANINETVLLLIISMTVVVIGLTTTGFVAICLTVVNLVASAVFAGFGGFLWFRNRVLDQGKVEIR